MWENEWALLFEACANAAHVCLCLGVGGRIYFFSCVWLVRTGCCAGAVVRPPKMAMVCEASDENHKPNNELANWCHSFSALLFVRVSLMSPRRVRHMLALTTCWPATASWHPFADAALQEARVHSLFLELFFRGTRVHNHWNWWVGDWWRSDALKHQRTEGEPPPALWRPTAKKITISIICTSAISGACNLSMIYVPLLRDFTRLWMAI